MPGASETTTVDRRVERRLLDRRIAALAIPSLGALAAEPLYVLADTAIVGHIGTGALGGLAIAGIVLTSLTWLVGFLSMGTTTRIATALGAGRPDRAARSVQHAAALALGIGVLLLLACEALAGPIVRLLGGSGEVRHAALTYLRIGALGVPFQLLAFVGHAWWRGHSRAVRSLQVVVVANLVNIGLELLFVYGLGWGIAGSAWGTVVAQVLAASWLVLGVRRAMIASLRDVAIETGHAASAWSDLVAMLREGWLITVRTLALVSMLLLLSATAARIGDSELGAHQIGMQLFTFLALCLDALAVPAQVFTGQAFGAGRPHEATRAVNRCLSLGLMIGVALGALVVATSGVVAGLFTDDGAVSSKAVIVLVLLGVLQVPGSVAFVLDGALLGAADYRRLQRATLIAASAFVPVAVAVLIDHDLGLVTLWTGLVGWMCVRAFVNWRRWVAVSAGARPPAPPAAG